MNNSIPKTSGIYKITCMANGKIYVGSSVDLHKRWLSHCSHLRSNTHHCSHLQRAWNKYGEQSFVFEVIELTSTLATIEREQYWLDTLKSYDENIGFNMAKNSTAPMLGRKTSPEARIKIGLVHKGKVVSEETRIKLRAVNKGRKHSVETRAKVSAASKGRKQSPETIAKRIASMNGYTHSIETREKISIANKGKCKGRVLSEETKQKISIGKQKLYIVIDPEGNKITVKGLMVFCQDNGLDISKMVKVAKGTRNHHKGWRCFYG